MPARVPSRKVATCAAAGFALLLLASPSAAQAGAEEPAVVFEVAPLAGPVRPLTVPVLAPATVTVRCDALLGRLDPFPVTFAVGAKPEVVRNATFEPDRATLDPDRCTGTMGTLEARTTLAVSTGTEGPAFEPVALALTAQAEGVGRGEATLEVVPGFFSILEATTPTTLLRVRPGGEVEVPIHVSSFGNAPVRVTFAVETDHPERVALPAPLLVPSRFTGDPEAGGKVRLRGVEGGLYHNDVTAFDVRVSAAHDRDPAVEGDTTTVSFLLTTKGSPAPAPAPALALLALAATGWAAGEVGRRGRGRRLR